MKDYFISKLKDLFPDLKVTLRRARINKTRHKFVEEIMFMSLMVSAVITVVLFLFIESWLKINIIIYPIAFAVSFGIFVTYFVNIPQIYINKHDKEINQDIIFAGRFLAIELDSGIDLYDAMLNISRNFKFIGKYFREIVEAIDLGHSIENAIENAIIDSPSENFRLILYQIHNSLRTGSNVADAVDHIINNVVREQHIEIKMFGGKLNPVAMFYMIIAVIFPSIGLTMFMIMQAFVGINYGTIIIISMSIFILFVQLLFLSIIRSIRPSIEY
ncbi:type II secretion system F family protein [Candidatus Woesearchaeota archaeon]|nr:type II secretion system F family protein [Candidatus Woesearchaeota archaeon]